MLYPSVSWTLLSQLRLLLATTEIFQQDVLLLAQSVSLAVFLCFVVLVLQTKFFRAAACAVGQVDLACFVAGIQRLG